MWEEAMMKKRSSVCRPAHNSIQPGWVYIGYMSIQQRKVDRARAEGRVVLERQGPLGVAAAFVDLARCAHTCCCS